jgi:hypothetical protein
MLNVASTKAVRKQVIRDGFDFDVIEGISAIANINPPIIRTTSCQITFIS